VSNFMGTSRPSDFPSTCMLDFWITSFSNRPVHNCVSGVDGTSRFFAREVSMHARGLRPRRARRMLAFRIRRCCLPHIGTALAL
jgi:hypothetical protein